MDYRVNPNADKLNYINQKDYKILYDVLTQIRISKKFVTSFRNPLVIEATGHKFISKFRLVFRTMEEYDIFYADLIDLLNTYNSSSK